MDLHKFREILKRYEEGTSNETENALVEDWYNSYKAEEKQIASGDAETIRANILKNICSETAVKRLTLFSPVFRIAAGLIIFLTTGLLTWFFIYRSQPYETVTTQTHELKEISLPDGSKVWLNSVSRISVPSEFNGNNREVSLEEGEAFFKVTKDPKHPFIVHTKHVNVRVLGTSFNVRAYQQTHQITVSVETGKVNVSTAQKILATLIPGQQLNYSIDKGTARVKSINTTEVNSWQKGTTYLTEANFAELSVTLKSIYGISLKAGNKKVQDYHFNMRLMHNLTQNEVLELINQIHQTKFRKEGNDIILY